MWPQPCHQIAVLSRHFCKHCSVIREMASLGCLAPKAHIALRQYHVHVARAQHRCVGSGCRCCGHKCITIVQPEDACARVHVTEMGDMGAGVVTWVVVRLGPSHAARVRLATSHAQCSSVLLQLVDCLQNLSAMDCGQMCRCVCNVVKPSACDLGVVEAGDEATSMVAAMPFAKVKVIHDHGPNGCVRGEALLLLLGVWN